MIMPSRCNWDTACGSALRFSSGGRPLPQGGRRTSRRFPPPWRADKIPGGYVVRDANGQALAKKRTTLLPRPATASARAIPRTPGPARPRIIRAGPSAREGRPHCSTIAATMGLTSSIAATEGLPAGALIVKHGNDLPLNPRWCNRAGSTACAWFCFTNVSIASRLFAVCSPSVSKFGTFLYVISSG